MGTVIFRSFRVQSCESQHVCLSRSYNVWFTSVSSQLMKLNGTKNTEEEKWQASEIGEGAKV